MKIPSLLKLRIMHSLACRQDQTTAELSKSLGVNYKNVYTAIRQLNSEEYVTGLKRLRLDASLHEVCRFMSLYNDELVKDFDAVSPGICGAIEDATHTASEKIPLLCLCCDIEARPIHVYSSLQSRKERSILMAVFAKAFAHFKRPSFSWSFPKYRKNIVFFSGSGFYFHGAGFP